VPNRVPAVSSAGRGLGPAAARISRWCWSAIQSGASSVGPSGIRGGNRCRLSCA